jgi:hypothetical protein
MPVKLPITKEYFVKRLAELCLRSGMLDFPKDPIDAHILLKSAMLLVGAQGAMTEKEISARLETWIQEVCGIKFFDRVTLRRRLVDEGYLTRSPDGSNYQAARPAPRADLFDPAVDEVDPLQAIADARQEIARRKSLYMKK